MMLRIGNNGFTLIEVMMATVVLALGSVLIYQAFFISLDTFDYYSTYLSLAYWMNEKIWQTQDDLRRLGPLARIERGGEFVNQDKNFIWNLRYAPIDRTKHLYRIDLALSWKRGKRRLNLLRSAYAMYEEE